MNKHIVIIIILSLLALGLANLAAQAAPLTLTTQVSPLPTPGTCGALASIQFPVMVQGLREEHAAELRLLPDWPETAALLTECGIVLPTWTVGNESRGIETVRIPDGGYQLVIDAPPDYFRDPKGYSFQVTGGRVVRYPGGSLEFKLVPPSEQRLPPCREPFVAPTGGPIEETRDLSQPGIDVCQSEGTVCLSCSPKQAPPVMQVEGASILSTGYHYAGPQIQRANQGVWGRNYVADPDVRHGGSEEFVVERVMSGNSAANVWIEAGWAEHSTKPDQQYVYQYNSVDRQWEYYEEYVLTPGSLVETTVLYDPDTQQWKARYYIGNGYHRVLDYAPLGFVDADISYNQAEAYISEDVHPLLPISVFDMNLVNIGGVWHTWNTQFSATTFVRADPPYKYGGLRPYDLFYVHSEANFAPLLMKSYTD